MVFWVTTFIVAAVAGVLGTFVGGWLLGDEGREFLRRRVGTPWRWLTGKTAMSLDGGASGPTTVPALVEQVLQVAQAKGLVLPVRRERSHPVVVTYSDGSKKAFFPDLSSMKRAADAGKVLPWEATWHRPPRCVSVWSEDELRRWLAENVD